MELWGPAIDQLGQLPNVYIKMGAVEEWHVRSNSSLHTTQHTCTPLTRRACMNTSPTLYGRR